jgi:hypothetical protein
MEKGGRGQVGRTKNGTGAQKLERRDKIWNIFYFSFPDIGNSGYAVRKFRFIIEDRGKHFGFSISDFGFEGNGGVRRPVPNRDGGGGSVKRTRFLESMYETRGILRFFGR